MKATRCRPARPWGAIPGGASVVLAWWLVAHSSGQGWVQALGDIVAAGILVGLVGPWLVLRRIRVDLVNAPTDTTAGVPFEVELRASRPARLTPISPAGRSSSTTAGTLILVAERRGVCHAVELEVATAAPFGMQWWSRRVTLALPHPLFVAPRRGHGGAAHSPRSDASLRDGGAPRGSSYGDLRAPRPYRPGDSRRMAHWPTTAHTGELMVREMEQPQGPPAEVRVALPPDPVTAETEAGRYLGLVVALLERDVPVLLTTTEHDGTVTAEVADRRDAARRLAAAL